MRVVGETHSGETAAVTVRQDDNVHVHVMRSSVLVVVHATSIMRGLTECDDVRREYKNSPRLHYIAYGN